MTVQFKLSASVGKMGANKPADVKIIQARLAGIKVKARPLYKGKADGKSSKDLIDAICAFQGAEKIKPSGKIMPGDSTTSKLKMRTPSAVKISVLPMTSGSHAGTTSNASTISSKTADQIKRLSNLPQEDASSLAKAVTAAGKDGIPLILAKVDITSDSRFQVTLEIDKTAMPAGNTTALIKSLAERVSGHVSKSTRWSSGIAGNLTYRSMHPIAGLKPGTAPSEEFTAKLGVDQNAFSDIQKSLAAGLEAITKIGQF